MITVSAYSQIDHVCGGVIFQSADSLHLLAMDKDEIVYLHSCLPLIIDAINVYALSKILLAERWYYFNLRHDWDGERDFYIVVGQSISNNSKQLDHLF